MEIDEKCRKANEIAHAMSAHGAYTPKTPMFERLRIGLSLADPELLETLWLVTLTFRNVWHLDAPEWTDKRKETSREMAERYFPGCKEVN